MRSFAHGAGFTYARMRDEEDEHVRVHRPHTGLEPNLLFQRRSDGGNCSPAPEDFRRVETSGLLYERFDPRFQLPFAVYGRRFRCSL